MQSSVFEGIKVVIALMIGLALCNPVTARAKEPELNVTIAENTFNTTVDENALNVAIAEDAGTAYIDDYMNNEALTSSSRAAAAEYFGIDSKDVQLLADFGISATNYTNMPATFTISKIFDPSYASNKQDKLTLFNIDDAGILSVIPYEYLDGTITFTANTAGHFFLVQDKSAPLTYTELETTASGYTIKATGNMPEGACLVATRVYQTSQLADVIDNPNYSIDIAFDIEILVDGVVWQPADHNETVCLTFENLNLPDTENLTVYRIDDEALNNAGNSAEAITELNANITDDGSINVETEHFTTYVVGSTTYDGTAVASGTWLGMTYETFDSDGDGTAETLVLSGTQTESTSTYGTNYYGKAPYYRNDVTTISFQSGTNLISGGHLFRGCSNLTTIDVTNVDISSCADFSYMFYGCNALTNLDISNFDTSNGTNFARMFYDCGALTSLDISNFNTSKGTNFTYMFYNCKKLTDIGTLSNWVVSNGTSFAYMFYNCNVLISVGDLSNWDVSNSANFSHMFEGCNKLTGIGNFSNWNVSNATNFSYMFSGCKKITSLDLSGFVTSKGADFNHMFYYCSGLISLDVSGFDTSNSTTFSNMFDGCSALTNLDVSGFSTSNSAYFNQMFSECKSLTSLDVSKFNTSKGINFKGMFYNCQKITSLDVSKFDTSNGTDFARMFEDCSALTNLDLSGFNTSSGTGFNRMFMNCRYLTSLDLSNFDTSKGTDFSDMFYGCSALTNLDVSNFDTSSVTSSSDIFIINDLRYLKRFSAPKTNSYNIALPVKTFSAWYLDDTEPKLEADAKTTYTSVINPVTDQPHTYIRSDIEGFSLPQITATLISGDSFRSAMYELSGNDMHNITSIVYDEDPNDTVKNAAYKTISTPDSEVEIRMCFIDGTVHCYPTAEVDKIYANSDCRYMFGADKVTNGLLENCTRIDLAWLDTSNTTNMCAMFEYCKKITSLDVSKFDTSKVTDMVYMFYGCSSLASLDISGFNTENVTDMSEMFRGCSSLANLDLSGFNTENVTNMNAMFTDCSALTRVVFGDKFDTSNVTDMGYMFYKCPKLTNLDVSGFKTENVTNMVYMFHSCSSLTDLDVSKFNTENVTNMSGMFYKCSKLTSLDVSKFETSNVTDMSYMFWNCSSLNSLDVSNFDTSNSENFASMFAYCENLPELAVIYFDTSKGADFSEMFSHCTKLTYLLIYGARTGNVFNTANGTNFDRMFYNCRSLTQLDISLFDCSKGSNFNQMLGGCDNLQHLIAPKTLSAATNIELPVITDTHWYLDDIEPFNMADSKTTYTSVLNNLSDQSHVYIRDDLEDFQHFVTVAYLIPGIRWRTALFELAGNSSPEISGFNNIITDVYSETADGSDIIENTITDIVWTDTAFDSTTDTSAICVSTSSGLPVYARMGTKDGKTVVELYTEADVVYLNSDCGHMFQCFDALETISFFTDKIDASQVSNANCMFAMQWKHVIDKNNENHSLTYTISLSSPQLTRLDLQKCTFEQTTKFTDMFYNCCRLVSLDISNFDTSSGINFDGMFERCRALANLDVSKFDTSNGRNFDSMFYGCNALTSLDVSKFDTSKGTDFSYMFGNCGALTNLNVNGFNTSNGMSFDSMFYNCSTLTSLDVSNFNTSNSTDFSWMFSGCRGLTSLDVSNFTTSKGTDFSWMFNGCRGLTSLDVSKFNTSNGTNFYNMFGGCSSLTSLDVSNFTTSKGTNFAGMFDGCSGLTSLDVSNFNTSKGTDFHSMFNGCSSLASLDISNFNTSSGTDFGGMFSSCSSLTSLDVSKFNTSKGTDFSHMFYGCSSLTNLDVNKFNTSQAEDLSYMFSGCAHLTSLNVRNFVFGENASYDRMFADCSELTTIYGLTDLKLLGAHMFSVLSSSNPLNDPLTAFLVSGVLSRYNGDFDAFWADNQAEAPFTYEEAKKLYEVSVGQAVYDAVTQGFNGDFDAFWETAKDDIPLSYDTLKSFYDQAIIEAQTTASQPKTVLYFADYEDFTSDCWFDYNWAADGRSVCIYNVSIPAVAAGLTLNTEDTTEASGTVDVAIEKFVSDEAIQITTPSVLKLTCTTDSTGYLTYMFSEADTSQTYEQLKDSVFTFSDSNSTYTSEGVTENETGPKYSAKEQYILPIFRGQDQKIRGQQYTGNLVLNFTVAN